MKEAAMYVGIMSYQQELAMSGWKTAQQRLALLF